jgi:hypothetical protein
VDGALVGAGSLWSTGWIVYNAKFEPCSLQAHKFPLHWIADFAKVLSLRGNPHYSDNLSLSIYFCRAAMLEVSGLVFQELWDAVRVLVAFKSWGGEFVHHVNVHVNGTNDLCCHSREFSTRWLIVLFQKTCSFDSGTEKSVR